MSAHRSAAARVQVTPPQVTSAPVTCPPSDAAFAAVISPPGLPPFVVWSRRPLEAAAADALSDAARTFGMEPMRAGFTARVTASGAASASVGAASAAPAQRGAGSYSKAYHKKASL